MARNEAEDRIEIEARSKTVYGGASRYILEQIKAFSLELTFEVLFFGDQKTLNGL